jgi:transcriptional regulator with XRE-family HTH domain
MNIGYAVKFLRKTKGLKQKDLAKQAGISGNALCSIEKAGAMPQKETLHRIAEALDVPTAYIVFFALERGDIPQHKQMVFDQLYDSMKHLLLTDL